MSRPQRRSERGAQSRRRVAQHRSWMRVHAYCSERKVFFRVVAAQIELDQRPRPQEIIVDPSQRAPEARESRCRRCTHQQVKVSNNLQIPKLGIVRPLVLLP